MCFFALLCSCFAFGVTCQGLSPLSTCCIYLPVTFNNVEGSLFFTCPSFLPVTEVAHGVKMGGNGFCFCCFSIQSFTCQFHRSPLVSCSNKTPCLTLCNKTLWQDTSPTVSINSPKSSEAKGGPTQMKRCK